MGLPFLDDLGSHATITRPEINVRFGSSASDAPFGGIVQAAAELLGGTDDAWRTHLASVALRRALAPEVDVLTIQLARSAHAPVPALEDEGSLELGAAGDLTKVFTGRIDSLKFGESAITCTACNGGRRLASLRANRAYENTSAVDIVGDLASGAGVSHRASGGGETLPRYVVDDTRSLLEHVSSLASLTGASVYFDGEGTLQLIEAGSGSSVRTFTYGVDIIQFLIGERSSTAAAIDAVGEGAAGEAGSNGAFWLRKNPAAMRATQGSGDATRFYRDARLRSAAAVSARASALASAHRGVGTRSELLVSGAPEIAPGALITLSDMPDSASNGEYFVRRVTHRFDPMDGFSSRLVVERRGAAGGGDLLSALGGLL